MKSINIITKYKNGIIDSIILLLICIFLLSYFTPHLLLSKTTINGGDTGSHYYPAYYLKNILLPKGKIMGWMQGNYAGFPLFYHYFPLPFIFMSFLSFFISMEVSFKLITILGIFLLPFCIYFAFRFLNYEFPVPIFASTLTLPFLFNQGNSMWGGNIPSTLAGEFCYSLGVVFVFLFFGSLYYGVKKQKLLLLNAIILFLVGFSHAYTLIFTFIIGFYFILYDFKRNIKYILGVYSLGFLLLAFWLLPVIGDIPYTTSFVFRWTINSIFEVFPLILIPFMSFSILTIILNLKDERTFYFTYLILACAFVYLAGPHIGVLDIRFIPFFQLLLTVFSATLFLNFKKNLKASFILPFIVLLLIVLWVNMNVTYIHGWIQWNYSGYESKSTWNIFSGINKFLKNSIGGRVEWEHTPLDESLGSIRSSETLPYFAQRQTLEGIHMLGAISAPFVFYIESETSYQSCNPIQDYFYSTFDLKRGIEHFKLFNVSQFVVRSSQVKEAIKNYPDFQLEKKVGEYNIYRLATNPEEYVSALSYEPVLFLTNDWRDVSYQWFSRKDIKNIFLVFKKEADENDRKIFHQIITDFSSIKKNLYPNKAIKVKSTIKDESIEIETSEIGRPLLIKVSYHPNWKVEGAEKVYLVSPSFMLIFPKSHIIQLTFTSGSFGTLGILLSLLGILIVFTSPFWLKKVSETTYIAPEEVQEKKKWIIFSTIAILTLGSFFVTSIFHPNERSSLTKARSEFNLGKYAAAKMLFKQIMDKSKKKSGVRNEAAIFYATCFVRENSFSDGANELRKFIGEYPNSFWTPQAHFDLAYCETNLGNLESAINIYQNIIYDFPTTTWAKYSKDRLKEIKKQL